MALERFVPIQRIHGVNGLHAVLTEKETEPAKPVVAAPLAHLLIAVRQEPREREAVTLALRMAAAQRARVTLLHVLQPTVESSLHWLDGIEKLHGAMSRRGRPNVLAIDQQRAELAAFLEREIPRELREGVNIHCDCRVGDVAHEIARFVEEQSAGVVLLCSCPSAWRLSLWPGLSQRLAGLLPRAVALMHART